MLIDTHCHLNFKVFRGQGQEVMERARVAGVERVVNVGTHLKNSRRAVAEARALPGVVASIGIHPHHVWDYLMKANLSEKNELVETSTNRASDSADYFSPPDLDLQLESLLQAIQSELTQLASEPEVVAVGEIGLDYHFYEQTQYESKAVTNQYKDWQKAFFQTQLEVAEDQELPVILHQREAVEDFLNFFERWPALIQPKKMVLHCCEPDQRLFQFARKYELFLGVDGDLTYDDEKAEFFRQVPLEMLLLETDSPFMLPEPERTEKAELRFKDRACEPAQVVVIGQFLADLKGLKLAEIAQVTTSNAQNLLGKW